MIQDTRPFSGSDAITVRHDEQPELYERAERAFFDGDGTFTHEGRRWRVGEGVSDIYAVIRPEITS